MKERKISKEEVRAALEQGETIEDYPEDWPFPSQLMLGIVEDRPLHVVAGFDEQTGICYIVTVYDPNPVRVVGGFQGEEMTMKCIMCKHGETERRLVSVLIDQEETPLIIKNVPADVCRNCGERYFDEETTGKLLDLSNSESHESGEVEIIRFAA